ERALARRGDANPPPADPRSADGLGTAEHGARVPRSVLASLQSLSANTQITPPWGTSVLVPRNVSSRACIRCASTPQPDCTATYCTPSMANELGTPVTRELGVNFRSSAPVVASRAQKVRSLVPPRKTRPPPVVRIGPQF